MIDSQVSSFGVAYLTVAIVMVFAVRNLLAGFMTMLPNVYPIGQIFGLISYFGIPVDIGTMMTASIAMGIGVDGTLHKLTWFRKGIADGKSREDSIALAVGHSGPAIWETSAVLALGMLMLYPSELLLVSRFGWLMAAIIAVAVVGDIVFLPALLGGTLGTILIKGVKRQKEKDAGKSSSHRRRFPSFRNRIWERATSRPRTHEITDADLEVNCVTTWPHLLVAIRLSAGDSETWGLVAADSRARRL